VRAACGKEEGRRMADIDPVVRHMMLCDDVRFDPARPEKRDVLGFFGRIPSTLTPPFPLRYPSLCVYVQIAGGRGSGDARVVIRSADTNAVLFRSPTRRVALPADPLQAAHLKTMVRDCTFPRAGLYWVRFLWNARMLAQEPLIVR
jgi:hypothetical protein